MNAGFEPVDGCWICGGRILRRVHVAPFELSTFQPYDPELAAYSGEQVDLQRCTACGFSQPAQLPRLERYFDRIYDQRWAHHWVEAEHQATYKDDIFGTILDALDRRVTRRPRRLLDVGAHAGRFMALAQQRGWEVEGIELNTRTAAQAAASTGAPVHQTNIFAFEPSRPFDAVTLTDVLEHIPRPLTALGRVRSWLAPGGVISVKVPNGGAQRIKETLRGLVQPGYRPTLAENLIHISHFTPGSLRLALSRAGFTAVSVAVGAPEMPDPPRDVVLRRVLFFAARHIPGALHTPLALNLQAIATADLRQ